MSTITEDNPSLMASSSDSNGVNGASTIKSTKQTDNNTAQASPYFSKPFLRKPSVKDLGIKVDDSPEKDYTEATKNGNQSSDLNGTSNHPEIKKSPPDKPPRASNRRHYTNPFPPPNHPRPSERTLSYVSKNKPLASQRHKSSFSQQLSRETKPVVTIATADDKALLYPWRMNAMGHQNGSLGVGIGLEFELSMEPRNMSRPVVQSPPRELLEERDCSNTIHVPSSSNDIAGMDKKPDELVCNTDEMEEISPVFTQYPPKPHLFMMESGIYDRLETKVEPTISHFLLSGDFDRLVSHA